MTKAPIVGVLKDFAQAYKELYKFKLAHKSPLFDL